MKAQEEKNHAKEQAKAQMESIVKMVAALNTEDDNERDKALEAICEDPLSVEVREGWHTPGDQSHADWTDYYINTHVEFKILLCWGGPAVRIIGEVNNGQPENPSIQYQDWGTGWTDYYITTEEAGALLIYCQQFYFGE
jgi:hypothetical protein